jgi:hypothetical protein
MVLGPAMPVPPAAPLLAVDAPVGMPGGAALSFAVFPNAPPPAVLVGAGASTGTPGFAEWLPLTIADEPLPELPLLVLPESHAPSSNKHSSKRATRREVVGAARKREDMEHLRTMPTATCVPNPSASMDTCFPAETRDSGTTLVCRIVPVRVAAPHRVHSLVSFV